MNLKRTPCSDYDRLDEQLGRMCDQYCKYPPRFMKQEEMDWRCARCPLVDIVAYVDELHGRFDC